MKEKNKINRSQKQFFVSHLTLFSKKVQITNNHDILNISQSLFEFSVITKCTTSCMLTYRFHRKTVPFPLPEPFNPEYSSYSGLKGELMQLRDKGLRSHIQQQANAFSILTILP